MKENLLDLVIINWRLSNYVWLRSQDTLVHLSVSFVVYVLLTCLWAYGFWTTFIWKELIAKWSQWLKSPITPSVTHYWCLFFFFAFLYKWGKKYNACNERMRKKVVIKSNMVIKLCDNKIVNSLCLLLHQWGEMVEMFCPSVCLLYVFVICLSQRNVRRKVCACVTWPPAF